MCFAKDRENVTNPNHTVSFSLGSVEYNMSLTEFCDKMGFASTRLIHDSRNPNIRPHNFDPQEFWLQITGQDHYEARSAKASMIHNPVFCNIHRVMAYTVFGRGNENGEV